MRWQKRRTRDSRTRDSGWKPRAGAVEGACQGRAQAEAEAAGYDDYDGDGDGDTGNSKGNVSVGHPNPRG